jgi:hypothetical protein
MAAIRCSNSIGLASNSSHPVAMACSRSLVSACADIPIIGLAAISQRIFRDAWEPMSHNGMVRPCSCPASDKLARGEARFLFDPMGSNDHCEQFDHSESNHQHRDRYRIVIEPMPLLCIHDAPPCSSNFDDIRTQVSDRIAAGRYFFVSSCWTSAVICGGTGAARTSYWTLR